MVNKRGSRAIRGGRDLDADKSSPTGALLLLNIQHLLIAMDFTVVFVALPTMGDDLGLTDRGLTYVTATYGLAFAAFLLLGGRAADVFGRRRVLLVGLALFVVASVVAVSGSAAALLVGRSMQGAAAGLITPAAQALVVTRYPEGKQRTRALSWWGVTGAGGLALGGPAAGVLTWALDWRAVLLVNVPIGLLCLVLAPRLIAVDATRETEAGPRFRLPAVLTAGAAMGLLVWTVAEGPVSAAADTLVRATAVVVLLGAFVLMERRSTDRLMHRDILRVRPVAVADLMSVFFGAALGGQFFAITLYLQAVSGMSALVAGLMFIPVTLFMVVGNKVGVLLIARIGPIRSLPVGLAIAAVAEVAMAFLPTGGGVPLLVPAMILLGLGQGIAFVAITVAATATVAAERQGVASGLLNVGMNIGQSIGPAVLAAIVTWRSTAALDGGAGQAEANNQGLHGAFLAIAAIVVVGLLVCGVLLRSGPGRVESVH
ncbi:MFS transporter, partial [Frankia casuarinae]